MDKKMKDLQLESFINDRQQFGPKKYELISESLLFEKDNISLIKNCANILFQIKQEKTAKDPLSATIQKIQKTNNKTENINRDLQDLQIKVQPDQMFKSDKWKMIEQNYILSQFVAQCCEDKSYPRKYNNFQQIKIINLELSITESKNIAQEKNKEQQKQQILNIIEQQAEANIDAFLTNCAQPSETQEEIHINIGIKKDQKICEQIHSKLILEPHELQVERNKDKPLVITLMQKVQQRDKGILPGQEFNKLFQNQERLKKIEQLNQKLVSKTQSITFSDIYSIYNTTPLEILNEILITLDLALSINLWDDALRKYFESIAEVDNKKELPLNTIQQSCEQLIIDYQVKNKQENIKYCDFNNEKEQQDYFQQQKQQQQKKQIDVPMKYLYEIDKQGIQMYTDDIQGNQTFYISISFNTKEQLIRGSFGQFLIDDSDMIRIYFVQIESFQKVIQSVMVKNDDLTKQLIKCLMVSAARLAESFIKMPTIFKHLQIAKQFNTNLQFPKDNKQINDLLQNLESKK